MEGLRQPSGDISAKCFTLVFGILIEVPHHLVSIANATNVAFPGSECAGKTLFRSGAFKFNTLVDVIGVISPSVHTVY